MTNQNTTTSEDRIIERARNGDTVSDLLEIINRLDAIIEEWKDATGVDCPQDFKP